MPTHTFEGVVIDAPEGVDVSFEGGRMCLGFNAFTGSVSLMPKHGLSANADKTPHDRPPLPASGTLFKRQRTATVVASEGSSDADPPKGADGDSDVSAPPVFPNGGLSQDSIDGAVGGGTPYEYNCLDNEEDEDAPASPPSSQQPVALCWDEVIADESREEVRCDLDRSLKLIHTPYCVKRGGHVLLVDHPVQRDRVIADTSREE